MKITRERFIAANGFEPEPGQLERLELHHERMRFQKKLLLCQAVTGLTIGVSAILLMLLN